VRLRISEIIVLISSLGLFLFAIAMLAMKVTGRIR